MSHPLSGGTPATRLQGLDRCAVVEMPRRDWRERPEEEQEAVVLNFLAAVVRLGASSLPRQSRVRLSLERLGEDLSARADARGQQDRPRRRDQDA